MLNLARRAELVTAGGVVRDVEKSRVGVEGTRRPGAAEDSLGQKGIRVLKLAHVLALCEFGERGGQRFFANQMHQHVIQAHSLQRGFWGWHDLGARLATVVPVEIAAAQLAPSRLAPTKVAAAAACRLGAT